LGDRGLWRARVTGDFGFAYAYATARLLRLANGPGSAARSPGLELSKYRSPTSLTGGSAEVLTRDPSPAFRARPMWIA
jgi:hypothetical protein